MKKTLLDTGPLFDFLLYRCIEEYGWESKKSSLVFIKNKKEKMLFLDYIMKIKPILIVPGVVVEVYSHAKRNFIKAYDLERFLFLVKKEILNLCNEDELVKLLDMPDNVFQKYGPVDCNIYLVAKKYHLEQNLNSIITGEMDQGRNNLYGYIRLSQSLTL